MLVEGSVSYTDVFALGIRLLDDGLVAVFCGDSHVNAGNQTICHQVALQVEILAGDGFLGVLLAYLGKGYNWFCYTMLCIIIIAAR